MNSKLVAGLTMMLLAASAVIIGCGIYYSWKDTLLTTALILAIGVFVTGMMFVIDWLSCDYRQNTKLEDLDDLYIKVHR